MRIIIFISLVLAVFVAIFGFGPAGDYYANQWSQDRILKEKISKECENGGIIWNSETGEIACLSKRGARIVKEIRK